MRGNISKFRVVTIDGPAASGKSTTARLVAENMKWLYLDTGAMYRAMTVKVLNENIALNDIESISTLVQGTRIHLEPGKEITRVFLDEQEVTEEIRKPEVDEAVGPVCEVREVRDAMVALQREMAKGTDLITEGRDQGSVVFPDADLKFFMVASIETRAKRRQMELKAKGISVKLEKMIEDIKARDGRDSERENSPLIQADDSITLDTSRLTIEEQVRFIISKIFQLQKNI